ncbi:integrase, partial [Streptomyces caelestis]
MASPPKLRQVDLTVLLAHPSTEILTPSPADTTASAALLSGLAREDDEQTVKVQHLQEVLTGYQLGDAALALDGEPRADFLPGIPLLHRYAVKAAELG